MIHLLYGCMSSLLANIMQYFVSKKVLLESVDGQRKMKPASELFKIDLSKNSSLKALSFIDVGTKAKTLFCETFPSVGRMKSFDGMPEMLCAAAAYLQKHLPFDNKVIEHAQFLDPVKRNDSASTNAISNLAFKIVKLFGTDKSRVFGVSQDVSAENIVDLIRHEGKMYLVDDIPQSFHIIEAGNTEGTKRVQNSY